MSSQTLFPIPGRSVPILNELAAQVGVTPEVYTEQCLRLGAYLALMVACSPDEDELSVLFERPDSVYDEFKLDFKINDEKPAVSETALEGLFAEVPPDDAVLDIDSELLGTANQLAAVFEVSEREFVEACVFFRWRWAVTRHIGGAILLNDGEPDVYIELEDTFLD